MKLREAIEILRENTMACWWPDGPYPGKRGTDWDGIFREVRATLKDIMHRQEINGDSPFFVLDAENPETAIYDNLMAAILAVRLAMANTHPA